MPITNPDPDLVHAENLETVKKYLDGWKANLDSLGIWVREPYACLFDAIAFSLLNKAFKLSLACLCLIEADFADEAYGLSRSVLECAINLRCLTLDPVEIEARAQNYLDFFHAERKYFLDLCRKEISDPNSLHRIESLAATERVDARWSDPRKRNISDWKKIEGRQWDLFKIVTEPHPLDAELEGNYPILAHYTTTYRAASVMVHCSIRALDNNFAVSPFPFRVADRLVTHYDHRNEPLVTITAGLHLAARYALFGVGCDRTEPFEDLAAVSASKLKYLKQS